MNSSSLRSPPVGGRDFSALFFVLQAPWAILSAPNGQSVSTRPNGPANELATTGIGFKTGLVSASPLPATG